MKLLKKIFFGILIFITFCSMGWTILSAINFLWKNMWSLPYICFLAITIFTMIVIIIYIEIIIFLWKKLCQN